MKIHENVPISTLTTMRLGGLARYVAEIEEIEDIAAAYKFAQDKNLSTWIMGGGANTIGRDAGFDGVILLNRIQGISVLSEDDINLQLQGMGGVEWDEFVEFACQKSFSGMEAMSMIPGKVGAAPVQNIGAYGQELSQIIESATVYDTLSKRMTTLPKAEMRMGYRHTRFNYGKDAGRFFIASITVKLHKTTLRPPLYNSLQAYIDQHNETDFSPMNIRRIVCALRAGKLPDPAKVASAGSFFKNIHLDKTGADLAESRGIPVWRNSSGGGKVNSGWLIDQCSLKGKELYGFRISERAALVLINEHAHSYDDLEKARAAIVDAVREKFGFTLEQEPVEMPEHANSTPTTK